MRKLIKLKSVKNNESVRLLRISNRSLFPVSHIFVTELPPSEKTSSYDSLEREHIHRMKGRATLVRGLKVFGTERKTGSFEVVYETLFGKKHVYIQRVKF